MRVAVIGAGIFGVAIAMELDKRHSVTLIDANGDIMQNASKVNHNRLHFGFHYPRSKETARQSIDGYELFLDHFPEAITSSFENYYMIEKTGHVTSEQYERFCDDLGLEYTRRYPKMDINFDHISSSYLTKEPIFDYDLIKSKLMGDLLRSGVRVVLNKRVVREADVAEHDAIINVTYFNLNRVNRIFDIDPIPLRLQTVVIPIFRYDVPKIGVTIMDGKFCSIMPKGFNDGLFLLYHAGRSVVFEKECVEIPRLWHYGKEIIKNDFLKRRVYDRVIARRNINVIARASKEYFRFLNGCDFVGYWQTVRALPINDNDERLSVFLVNEVGDQKVVSVLSGKISTCFLMANEISGLI